MLTSLAAPLDRLLLWTGRASRAGVWFGGLLLLASVAMIAVEILMRRTLGWTFRGAHELSGYVLAISTAWAFAFALLQKAHIRVDAVYVRLGPAWRAVLDVIAMTLLGLFVLMLAVQTWEVLATSLQRGSTANTPLRTPLWIPQLLWWSGLVWFALVTLLLWLRLLVAAMQRDAAEVQRLVGSKTLEEELREVEENRR